jgi:hypothetical protein
MGHTKASDGFYHIKGGKYELLCGSRAQVLHGTAYKTTGGLTKADLIQNKNGRIVSRKKHNHEKKVKRLAKHGYTAKKGKFGAVRMSTHSRHSRRSRGGTSSVSMGSMNTPVVSETAMNKVNPTNLPIVSGGKRGGYSNSSLSPAGAQSNYQIMSTHSRRSRGGTSSVSMGSMNTPVVSEAAMNKVNPTGLPIVSGGKRGGYSNSSLSPAGAQSNYQIMSPSQPYSPMRAALMAGGKKGGYPNSIMSPAGAQSNYRIMAPSQHYSPMRAALMAGGKRGGYTNSALSPAGAHSNYQLSSDMNNPTNEALLASGGRRRTRVRRGGSLQMTPLNDAYQGLNQYVVPQSFTPQMNALTAGV